MSDTTKDKGAAAIMRRPECRIERVWHITVEGLAAVGTVLIGVLLIIICADIIARNSMGASLP